MFKQLNKCFISILIIFIIFSLKLFSQKIYTIHTSKDKTTLLSVEELGNKFFVFFYDSTFFDKRIRCKIFERNNPNKINEFYLTPELSTFQNDLITKIVSDKLIFVAFVDYKSDTDGDLYSQLIDEEGILWDSGGIPICTSPGIQKNLQVEIDNTQSIFIVWEDYRKDKSGDIFAQKIDLFGNLHWKKDGVVVTNLEGEETKPSIAPNYSGGCYVSWVEKIVKTHKVYLQQLNNNGEKLFGQYGFYLSNPDANAIECHLRSTNNSFLNIFYLAKNHTKSIYLQKISNKGVKYLGITGKKFCSLETNQEFADIEPISSNDIAVIFLTHDSLKFQNAYLQILNNGEKQKFKKPIEFHSVCKFYQKPKLKQINNGFFIYWTCFHDNSMDISLFIQTINYKGEILKTNGLKIYECDYYSDSKFFLNLTNLIECISSNFDNRNGIYYSNFYLYDFISPKIENFKVTYYEGLVKINWDMINLRNGTMIFLERMKNGENMWEEIYSYKSTEKSYLKQMNYDDFLFRTDLAKYRIRCVDPEGNEAIIENEIASEPVTDGFYLFQNLPNPFTDSTKITFQVPKRSKVSIKVYNSRLEEIEEIFNNTVNPGLYEVIFRPSNLAESGIYFYKMSTTNFYSVKKMIYTR